MTALTAQDTVLAPYLRKTADVRIHAIPSSISNSPADPVEARALPAVERDGEARGPAGQVQLPRVHELAHAPDARQRVLGVARGRRLQRVL